MLNSNPPTIHTLFGHRHSRLLLITLLIGQLAVQPAPVTATQSAPPAVAQAPLSTRLWESMLGWIYEEPPTSDTWHEWEPPPGYDPTQRSLQSTDDRQ
jgi:hypothetical protein